MVNTDINSINNLTFGQLRNELANCNDPIKEKLLRNIMLIRYKQHLRNKTKYNVSNKTNNYNQFPLNENDFELTPNINTLNEVQENDDLYDNRDINEYDRDLTNNNLMNRLNSDIDIYTKGMSKQKPDFIPPYINNVGDDYASLGAFQGAPFINKSRPTNNFNNIRPNKKKLNNLNNNTIRR